MSFSENMPDDLRALCVLIRREFGVDFSSSADQLSRKIGRRLAATRSANITTYLAHLQQLAATGGELRELANDITNNETYFFREPAQLAMVCNELVPQMLASKPAGEHLRILSAPCSSGEEPYSIAMCLLRRRLPVGSRITIYGCDLSERSIAQAREGRYRQSSFRGMDADLLEQFFEARHSGYGLRPIVKNNVQFSVANLLDMKSLRFAAPYDIIFCRNIMIYFDRETQMQVLENVSRLLVPGGYLCLGHADTAPSLQTHFDSDSRAGATVYRRKGTN